MIGDKLVTNQNKRYSLDQVAQHGLQVQMVIALRPNSVVGQLRISARLRPYRGPRSFEQVADLHGQAAFVVSIALVHRQLAIG